MVRCNPFETPTLLMPHIAGKRTHLTFTIWSSLMPSIGPVSPANGSQTKNRAHAVFEHSQLFPDSPVGLALRTSRIQPTASSSARTPQVKRRTTSKSPQSTFPSALARPLTRSPVSLTTMSAASSAGTRSRLRRASRSSRRSTMMGRSIAQDTCRKTRT